MDNIIVIDYGLGNLLSVRRGLEYCGANVVISQDPSVIRSANKVVLPGVGAFANGMHALAKLGLVPIIRQLAFNGIPLLGICLGMQMLMDQSEEFGITDGLGIIPGKVRAIPNLTTDGKPLKIPHIGWNELEYGDRGVDWKNTWLSSLPQSEAMYFVHSYMAEPLDKRHRIADCRYGGHSIAAVIGRDNIMGCQFHPEKSGGSGLAILSEFCRA